MGWWNTKIEEWYGGDSYLMGHKYSVIGELFQRLVLVPDRSIRQAVVEARTTCLV